MARNMSNLTPAQLEQFESTFRYFDRDGNNTLSVPEMTAALASLGIVYSVSWKEMLLIWLMLRGFLAFRTKMWIRFMGSWYMSMGL